MLPCRRVSLWEGPGLVISEYKRQGVSLGREMMCIRGHMINIGSYSIVHFSPHGNVVRLITQTDWPTCQQISDLDCGPIIKRCPAHTVALDVLTLAN